MLDTTLNTEFIPGSNLKGDVAGANWTFLLPNLDIGRVLIIGLPTLDALKTLSRLTHNLVIICLSRSQLQEVSNFERSADSSKFEMILAGYSDGIPIRTDSFNLIFLADAVNSSPADAPSLLFELNRVRRLTGLVYLEFSGSIDRLGLESRLNRRIDHKTSSNILWLTPLTGETHTAVPASDTKMIDFFISERKYSPSINIGIIKDLKRKVGKAKPSHRPSSVAGNSVHSDGAKSSGYLDSFMRAANLGTKTILERIEHLAIKRAQSMWRYGLLIGPASASTQGGPPVYLREIASSAGVDIHNYHWGLSARGDYSSRKVLFYLFGQEDNGTDGLGTGCVVKLVRDTIYNYRLENEYQALLLLEHNKFAVNQSVPQVKFFGYHKELAVLGESMIAGEPFRKQTGATADCPYFQNGLDYLLELAAFTSNSSAASPVRVSEALEVLLSRFLQIYKISPRHRAFLEDQIESIKNDCSDFPLVFQHGDPGTWNALVTPSGRVTFLDWEAAEPQGLPLWDLFYFIRSYSVGVARSHGVHARIEGFDQQFLCDSPLSRSVISTIKDYSQRIALSEKLVEPLFYTCWMHRALKESTRLVPDNLEAGHYVNLLRWCIEHRNAPTLKKIFVT
jgi:hypothetical protein